MPASLRGIGSAFYGARDFRPDGTHVTTEWFVFIYVPVVPRRSLRIHCTGDNQNRLVYARCRYSVVEKVPLDGRQVLAVYAWFAVVLPSFLLAFQYQRWWIALPGVMAFFVPGRLRKRAIERMKEQEQRIQMGLETQ